MPNRLSTIATRTGDDGSTGLGDGSRVRKDAPRIQALGSVDELNCHLGVLRTEALPGPAAVDVARVQNDLFDLGGELSIPGHTLLAEARVAWLDERLAHYNGQLKPLAEFILPGGTRAAAFAHVARAAARRAERDVIALAADEPVGEAVRLYLNRVSDLLFVLARWLNLQAGGSDVLWQR